MRNDKRVEIISFLQKNTNSENTKNIDEIIADIYAADNDEFELELAEQCLSASKVKEMIKHQEEKYNWTFVYMGSDLTNASDANSLGFGTRLYSTKADYGQNYDVINCAVSAYRCSSEDLSAKSLSLDSYLKTTGTCITEAYAAKNGLSVDDLLNNNA